MLESNSFAIQERKKMISAAQTCDIRDGDTGELIGHATEKLDVVNQWLRWLMSKQLLPTVIEVREKPDDSLLFTLNRRRYLFRSHIDVRDAQGNQIGILKSNNATIGGGFRLFNKAGKPFAQVEGSMQGFDYRIMASEGRVELGRVAKRIEGEAALAREPLFASDSYFLTISPELADEPLAKMLLLAATLSVGLTYKSESNGVMGSGVEG